VTATTFEERYANHTSSFRHKKDSNKDYTIKWSILKHAIPYTGGSNAAIYVWKKNF
jgi:hypothetical protein